MLQAEDVAYEVDSISFILADLEVNSSCDLLAVRDLSRPGSRQTLCFHGLVGSLDQVQAVQVCSPALNILPDRRQLKHSAAVSSLNVDEPVFTLQLPVLIQIPTAIYIFDKE